MNWLLAYAIELSGLPYVWGGNNPLTGFDCSGYVQWVLKAAGIDPPGDQTAQALYDYFERNGNHVSPQAGALVFYGRDVKHITHVGFAISPYQMMEAGGGDSTTRDYDRACEQGACVRMSLIEARKDLVASVKPHYVRIGIP
jgi:cell wall-associated NlpC family hydrolase